MSNVSSFPETQAGAAKLAALVRDFDRDAEANRQAIAELLQNDPEGFCRAAIETLKEGVDSPAAQCLSALLVSGNLLFRGLCDPALDREQAISLARQAHSDDPTVDVTLLRKLADANAADPGFAPGMAERLLEIIDRISDGKRILPVLMRMLGNDNPFLRSKAVLMIGRSGRSINWIEKRLQEADTRVRANAIEALWGIDPPEARELLRWATWDSNNRVVGNALVGLYRLGIVSPLAELVKMAAHDSWPFRRTAAWAMGATGDPRFGKVLGRMIADSSGNVRKSAFAAVRRLREAAAQVAQTAQWPVAIAVAPQNTRAGERVVSVAVSAADGQETPSILPVQFLLTEDGEPVWSYRVARKEAPAPLSAVLVFPRTLDKGASPCLKWQRSTDVWSTLTFPDNGDAEASRSADTDFADFWTALQHAAIPGNVPPHGQRHLIVVAPDQAGDRSNGNLISVLRASYTSIQVLSTFANSPLRQLCRRIEGHFQHVNTSAALEEAVSLAYLSLLPSYEIRYRPIFRNAASVKLRVQTPTGWGEATVQLL